MITSRVFGLGIVLLCSPCMAQMDFGLSNEVSAKASDVSVTSVDGCGTLVCAEGVTESANSYSLSDLMNLGVFEGRQVPQPQFERNVASQPRQVTLPLKPFAPQREKLLTSVDVEVFFKLGSYELDGVQNRALAAVASKLSRISGEGYSLAILGHTDKRGSHAFNQALSDQRAKTVKRFLEPFLDSNAEIYTKGMSYDALKNSLDPYASENRRVQIILIPSGAVASQSPK